MLLLWQLPVPLFFSTSIAVSSLSDGLGWWHATGWETDPPVACPVQQLLRLHGFVFITQVVNAAHAAGSFQFDKFSQEL